MSFNVSHTTSEEYSFTQDSGTTIGVETGIQTGIPFLAEGKVSVSAEKSYSYSKTTTQGKAKTWSATFPVKVPKKKTYKATVSVKQSNLKVPYTATITHAGFAPETVTGVFKGVDYFNLVYKVEEVKTGWFQFWVWNVHN